MLAGIAQIDDLDLYVLASERSAEVVRRFRDQWLEGFEATRDEYEFPEAADRPVALFHSPWELIDRLLADSGQPWSLYWSNPRPWSSSRTGQVRNGMLFFTTDGGLIAGLTVASEGLDEARICLRQLAETVGGRCGFALGEMPPPPTAAEFRAWADGETILRLA